MKNQKIIMILNKTFAMTSTLLLIFSGFSCAENVILTGDSDYTFTMPDYNLDFMAESQVIKPWGGGGWWWGWGWWWWGWWWIVPDDHDISEDPVTESSWTNVDNLSGHNSADSYTVDRSKFDPNYSDEMNEAYQYAYSRKITTMDTIDKADMWWNLTRIAMAKMLSQYAINELWLKPDKTRQNKFADVSGSLDSQYNNWVTLAYQLWFMWINMPNNKFRPFDNVTRAEFVTALSRMKYWTSDWEYAWTPQFYKNHMDLLAKLWVITNTDPAMLELRWYVMIMLMRAR